MTSRARERSRPSGSKTRVGVISLGCAKNLVDTEVMLGHLDRAGCAFVQDPAEADVIVVNTCGFIDAARAESVQTILDAAELKTTGGLQRLVVAGCMVQRYRRELERELPEVDAFIGLDELDRIVACAEPTAAPRPTTAAGPRLPSDLPLAGAGAPLAARPATTSAGASVPSVAESNDGGATYLYDHRTARRRATPDWTAYVKIAEGCDHTCAFCAIPSFRGTFRSREAQSIVREVEGLAADGVREVNLIAQDSSHFGRDRGESNGLAQLLEALDRVEALRWLRVHYLYPNTITPALIETMARLERVVNYVDLPLQHAHPATLARMRRGGSAEGHLKLLARFRAAMPGAALRSTFIVGFPGETDEEFEALLAFVREARFDHLGVFTYSHEDGTPALDRADDVPAAVKEQRFERLMALQQEIAFSHARDAVGRVEEVLVEGAHAETDHLLVGRTRRQAPDVDGQILINEGIARPGTFVKVEMTETAGYDLVGKIVGAG